jgi:DNA topoisomerase I
MATKKTPKTRTKKPLVIVESPTKVRTISRYLGGDYRVASSKGHIRDLPKSKLSVDLADGFAPTYEVIPRKKKVVEELRREARGSKVYLACDPDREGEAICWHLAQLIDDGADLYRITFNEITKSAILKALENPGRIDQALVDAQQARRILDRLVGYQVSPILWKAVRRGLSAGRVQSVALRLIVERELEREAFDAEEFWNVAAALEVPGGDTVEAQLVRLDGKKARLRSWESVRDLFNDLHEQPWRVADFKKRLHKRRPQPPYITSTLQQDASTRLGFNPKRTMRAAQRLYEGVELGKQGQVGLITYMRTDSVRISDEGLTKARDWIGRNHPDYLPAKARSYRGKKGAQDAHEAVRPTDPDLEPSKIARYLDPDQRKLYELIWGRFLASQMTPAIYDKTEARLECDRAEFSAKGSVLRDPGFLTVYPDPGRGEDNRLPVLEVGSELESVWLDGRQKFTQPPARFKAASLVKELEKSGIGRPSTYAAILSTLMDREYVVTGPNRSLVPTELGRLVIKLLLVGFPKLLKVDFTAEMERDLDEIARGERDWRGVLDDFYTAFRPELERAEKELPKRRDRETRLEGVQCPLDDGDLVIKFGKAGPFVGCTNYPECTFTANFHRDDDGGIVLEERSNNNGADKPEPTDVPCPLCGEKMVVRSGRRGEFLGCSRYPDCKGTLDFTLDENGGIVPEEAPDPSDAPTCEKCGAIMVRRKGRFGPFWGCSNYPKCRSIVRIEQTPEEKEQAKREAAERRKKNQEPEKLNLPCPVEGCSGTLIVRINRYGKEFFACDAYPECKFSCNRRPVESPCPNCGFSWREPYYKKLRCHHCGHSGP